MTKHGILRENFLRKYFRGSIIRSSLIHKNIVAHLMHREIPRLENNFNNIKELKNTLEDIPSYLYSSMINQCQI